MPASQQPSFTIRDSWSGAFAAGGVEGVVSPHRLGRCPVVAVLASYWGGRVHSSDGVQVGSVAWRCCRLSTRRGGSRARAGVARGFRWAARFDPAAIGPAGADAHTDQVERRACVERGRRASQDAGRKRSGNSVCSRYGHSGRFKRLEEIDGRGGSAVSLRAAEASVLARFACAQHNRRESLFTQWRKPT